MSTERLDELLALASSGPDWLRDGLERYLCSDASLEAALGLTGTSGLTARRAFKKRHRDELLREAWRSIIGALGPWERTQSLWSECRRVESLMPSLRHLTNPPAHFSPIRRLIFEAFRTGEPMPSPGHLHRICHSHSRPVSMREWAGDPADIKVNRGSTDD